MEWFHGLDIANQAVVVGLGTITVLFVVAFFWNEINRPIIFKSIEDIKNSEEVRKRLRVDTDLDEKVSMADEERSGIVQRVRNLFK